MDITPKSKTRKLSCKHNQSEKNEKRYSRSESPVIGFSFDSSSATSTPTQQSKNKILDDYSPVYLLNTQESHDDVDVVWDWNSPQTKPKFIRKQKRLLLPLSPKKTIKKHPSNNQIPTFDQIKGEMEALRDNMLGNKTEEESCLVFEISSSNNIENPFTNKVNIEQDVQVNLETFLEDDSIEEQLLLCSQEVENKIGAQVVNSNITSLMTGDMQHFNKDVKVNNFEKISLDVNKNLSKPVITNASSSVSASLSVNKSSLMHSNQPFKSVRDSAQNYGNSTANVKSESHGNKKSGCDKINFDVTSKIVATTEPFKRNGLSVISNKLNVNSDSSVLKPSVLSITNLKSEEKCLADDSFEQALATFDDEDIELLTQAECSKAIKPDKISSVQCTFGEKKQSFSDSNFKNNQSNSGSFHNTDGRMQTSWAEKKQNEISTKCTLDEIERKRLQALAKLEAKKKQDSTVIPHNKLEMVLECETSPIKCSPEEIEQKRLQALARLEAKKKQEIIERNRLEALKRLQMNKRKRELQMKSTLPRRTDYAM